MIYRIKLPTRAIVLIALLSLTEAALGGDGPLKMYVVQLPINSYRLLAMEMDEGRDIWFGSIHHVIHRYIPTTGAVETIQLPQTTAGYPLWASQCLPASGKVYILGQAYPKLIIYDPRTKKFNETNYPSSKSDVWYGVKHPDGRHLYFFDRGGVGLIKWDSQTDTGKSIPYPYRASLPSFGRYEARDKAIWCGIWDYTGGQYQPIAIARFNVQSDSFTGLYPFPKNDGDLKPYSNPDTTIFYAWTLKGKIVPFDFKTKRWCKFMDVPEFDKRYGFIGISTLHKGKFYFSLSTYNGGDNLGIDGNQYHFANSILVLDPKTKHFDFLTLNVPGKYYQIAYTLSANGEFYATGSNVLTPEGTIVRENKGDIIVWQTQPLRKEMRSARSMKKSLKMTRVTR